MKLLLQMAKIRGKVHKGKIFPDSGLFQNSSLFGRIAVSNWYAEWGNRRSDKLSDPAIREQRISSIWE
jgi:hypothetical protein